MIICPNCSKENEERHKFCLGCGARLPAPAATPPPPPPVDKSPAPPPPAAPPPAPGPAEGWGSPPPGVTAKPPSGPAGPPPLPPMTPPPSPDPVPAGPTPDIPPQVTGVGYPGGPPPGGPGYPPSGPAPAPGYPPTGGPPPAPAPGYPPTGGPPAAPAPGYPPTGGPPAAPAPGPGYPPTGTAPPPPASAPEAAAAVPEGHHVCVSCSFVNPPGFAFCGRCGAKITPAAVPTPVEDAGSARTVFADHAPEELARLREQGLEVGAATDRNAVGPAAPVTAAPPSPPSSTEAKAAATPPPSQSQTAAPVQPTGTGANPGGPAAKLVMLGPDGSPIGERVLAAGERLNIGRAEGPPWDEDAYLDDSHGSLTPTEEGIVADDAGSLNGIYVKLSGRVEIHNGDQFRVGQELLLYEDLPEPMPTDDGTERMGSPNPGYWGRLSLLVDPEVASQAYAIKDEGLTIGREQGEITFPTDGYVSGSHCRVVGDDSGVFVEDLGSSNGTYMRVRPGAVLPYGSLVLIGQKLFQLERA